MLPALAAGSDLLAAADPAQLLPARQQMAFTLGFHIILVPFGVAFTFGLPLVVVSGLAGVAALLLLRRAAPRLLQALAVLAVAAVVVGWGVAQYPYLLGTHLSIGAAAAPEPTLWALTVVAAAALLIVVPSMALLFVLGQRGRLESH